jgi:hypothetical protein
VSSLSFDNIMGVTLTAAVFQAGEDLAQELLNEICEPQPRSGGT